MDLGLLIDLYSATTLWPSQSKLRLYKYLLLQNNTLTPKPATCNWQPLQEDSGYLLPGTYTSTLKYQNIIHVVEKN